MILNIENTEIRYNCSCVCHLSILLKAEIKFKQSAGKWTLEFTKETDSIYTL